MPRVTEVRKRDNRIVPFDQSKIGDAIYKAVRSVGAGDRALADDLAAAVTLFLEKRFAGGLPGIEDIQDMVETVLNETGHAQIARAYIEYRTKRTKIRDILKVRKELPGGPEVDPESHTLPSPWSKAKIVAALVKEADLDTAIAEQIAASVEEKVFRSELKRISTALIRELVDNELFERGHAAKLNRQAPIGVPKYNLAQVIFSTDAKEPYSFAKDPEDIDALIARHVLRHYALEDIHSSEVAEASRDGRLVLHRAGDPLRLHRVMLPPTNVFPSPRDVAPACARLLRAVSSALCVPAPGSAAVLHELALLAHRRIPVTIVATRDVPFDPMPDPKGMEATLRFQAILDPYDPAVETLIRDGAAYYTHGFNVSFRVAPRAAPAAVAGKISLNLPQLACRSGRTRLGDLFGEIDHALGLALKAHIERKSFLARVSRAPELPLWNVLGGGAALLRAEDLVFAIGVFGLADAVKFMTGREPFQDARALALGREIIEHLARKTEREARGLGLPLILEETESPRLLQETAQRDARIFPELAEIFRGRPAHLAYTPGVRMPSRAPLDPLTRNRYLAQVFPLVALGGIVGEDPELRSGGEDIVMSLLEESLSYFRSEVRLATAGSGKKN